RKGGRGDGQSACRHGRKWPVRAFHVRRIRWGPGGQLPRCHDLAQGARRDGGIAAGSALRLVRRSPHHTRSDDCGGNERIEALQTESGERPAAGLGRYSRPQLIRRACCVTSSVWYHGKWIAPARLRRPPLRLATYFPPPRRLMRSTRSLIATFALVALPLAATAADDPRSLEFFENKIRPVLVEQCYKCHGEDAAKQKKLKGGLRLDSKAGWQKGGETGPAIVPGKPNEGSLLASLKYDGEIQMPPKSKLPANVIANFEKWIKDGAVDPRGEATMAKAATIDFTKAREFWSFRQPVSHAKPSEQGAIDSFIAAKWAEKGLTPVSPADKRTLIRRVYFDLTGLPPSPEAVDAFLADKYPDAFAKLIDK